MWLLDVPKMKSLPASDFANIRLDVEFLRVASTLRVRTPYDFGAGDPFSDSFGDQLRSRVSAVSSGVVTDLAWEFSGTRKSARRASTSDLDIYTPGDPLPSEYPEILANLRRHLPADLSDPARAALAQIRLVGASRYRLWFAAPSVEARDQLGKVPGARGALVTAIQAVTKHDVPLYRVVVDSSYRAEGIRLLPEPPQHRDLGTGRRDQLGARPLRAAAVPDHS